MAYRSEMEIGVNQRRIQSDIVSGVKRGAQMASPAVIRVQIPTMDFKKFSAPLGRITGDLNQFQGALDASIARTLAFGASASVLAGVGAALRGIVQAGIEVEAAMAGINSILQLSSSGLAKFSGDMFDVARNTAQSFKDVSTAALELSRTGLNAEDTLKRLNGAMILSRLTGMDSAVAVKALTAAVNGFSKEGITDIEIVNRLANVETKYAVSARDLADAVSRSGAVAQDAGVSFNELISIVTSVQQQTARGGAVIGNGFKSIFTRIQRAGVREELERIGVATSDSAGAFRGAIPILQDYARVYQTLSDAEKSSTAEKIAGVFQINTLKAALNDLNKEYSVYGGALDVANSTTDEAIQRNEQLNQTTAALLANTTTSLKEFGAALSGLAAEEGLRNVLNIVNTVATKMADLMDEEKGNSIAKAIMGGMGKFIAGPGLLMIGKTFFNLLKFLGGQTITVLKQLSTLSVEKEKQQKIEQAIGAALKNNEMAVNKIIGAEGNRVVQEQIILGVIKEQQVAMKQLQAVQAAISRSAASGMFAVGAGGMATTKPKKASGYVPNFAASAGDVISERIAANNAGYEAGRVYNTRIHDGSGGSFQATVNDREKIQTVIGPNGNKGTYVIPPTVGRGFIPNFGLNAKIGSAIRMGKMTLAEAQAKYPSYIPSSEKISKNKPIETSVAGKLGMIVSQKLPIGEVTGRTFKDGQEYRIKFQRAGFNLPIRPENVDLEKNVIDNLARFTNGYMSKLFPKGDFQKVKSKSDFTNIGSINSFIGTAFETAVKRGTGGNTKVRDTDPSRIIDFPTPSDKMRRLFHGMPGMYEAKWADNSALRNDVARKAIDSGLVAGVGGTEKGIREISKIKGRKNKALGFIPNFAAQTVFQRARKGGMNRGAMVGSSLKAISAEQQKLKSQVAMGASDPTLQAIMTTIMSLIKQDGQIDPAEVKAWSDTINFLKAKARNFVANKFPQRLAPTSPKGKIMAGGYAPKFVDQIQKTMAFEKQVSGQRPIFDTKPFPHVRNASQPTFQSAMNDHGGLRNALRDSSFGQKSAGLASGYVPNFGGTFSGANVGEQITLAAKKAGVSFNDNSVAVKANSGAIKQSTVGVKQMATSSVQAKTAFQRATGGISDFVKRARASLFGMPGGKGRNLLGAGGPAAGQKGSGMGAMGAYFAAQSLLSGMEQKGGRTGELASVGSQAMNAGYMTSMMAGPAAGMAVGATTALISGYLKLSSSSEKLKKELSALEESISKNSGASSNYIQKMEEMNSALKEGDSGKVSRLRDELEDALNSFDDVEFANKMRMAGGSLKELGEIAGEFAQSSSDAAARKRLEVGASGIKDIERKENLLRKLPFIMSVGGALRGESAETKAWLEGEQSLDIKDAREAQMRDLFSYGKGKINKDKDLSLAFQSYIEKRQKGGKDYTEEELAARETLLSEESTSSLTQEQATLMLGALYKQTKLAEIQNQIREKNLALDKKALSINQAIAAITKQNISKVKNEQAKREYGSTMFADIFQAERKSKTRMASTAGYMSAYDVQSTEFGIDKGTQDLQQQISASKILSDATEKIYALSGNQRAGKGLEDPFVQSAGFDMFEKLLSGEKTPLDNVYGRDKVPLMQAFKYTKEGEFSGIDIGVIDDQLKRLYGVVQDAANIDSEAFNADAENAKEQIKIWEEVKEQGIKQINELTKIRISSKLAEMAMKQQKRQEAAAAISSDVFLKTPEQLAEVSKNIRAMETGSLKTEPQIIEAIRALTNTVSKFAGTETGFSNLATFGVGQRTMVENISQTGTALGFKDLIQKEYSETIPSGNGYAASRIVTKDLPIAQQLQSGVNSLTKEFDKLLPEIIRSAKNINKGVGGDKDYLNMTKATFLTGARESARTAIENQQRSLEIYGRAIKKYEENEALPSWASPFKENKTFSDYVRDEEKAQGRFDAMNNIMKAIGADKDGEERKKLFETETFKKLGITEDMSKAERSKRLAGATDMDFAKLMSEFSTEPTEIQLVQLNDTAKQILEKLTPTEGGKDREPIDIDFSTLKVEFGEMRNLRDEIRKELEPAINEIVRRIQKMIPEQSTGLVPASPHR